MRLSFWSEDRFLLFLGFLLPLASMFGDSTQLVIWYCAFVLFGVRRLPSWSTPFLFLIVSWCSARIGTEIGLWTLNRSVNFTEWALVSPSVSSAFLTLLRVLLPFVIYSRFKNSTSAFLNFSHGVAWGIIGALFVGVLSFAGIAELPNKAAFWSEQGRYSSSFTDPNAAGVFLALFFPVLLSLKTIRREVVIFTSVSTFVLGIMSGSRTFLLGILIYSFMRIPSFRWKILSVIGGFGFIMLVNILQMSSPESYKRVVDFSPPAISRALNTVVRITSSEALFSREAFFKIATEAWIENPIIGIGPGQFLLRVTEFAERTRVPIGLWRDNPNNYYLGILAEYGLLGLIALFYGLSKIRFSAFSNGSKYSLIILAILLLSGPHLDFNEVSILVGFLLTDGVVEKSAEDKISFGLKFAAPFLGCAILSGALFGPSGLYEWERDDGGFFRWTSVASRIKIPCDQSGKAELRVRNVLPNIPQGLDIYSPFSPPQAIIVGIEDKLSLVCEFEGGRLRKVPVTIVAKSPWRPIDHDLGNDKRFLGVQLRLDPLR